MMRGSGSNLLKFITGGLAASVILFSTACKQSVAEKNAEIVQKAMPEMQVQKDSLKIEVQQVKQEFEVLKGKIDQVPAAVLDKPENAKLLNTLQSLVNKSGQLDGLIPGIEAKLEELNRMNRENPSEAVQHEIEVLQERLKIQRGRMDNYLDTYKKLESQLDSIQKISQ